MTLNWKRANKTWTATDGNRVIWLVYRTNTNAHVFWLVERTPGWKNFMPDNFLEINGYLALTSYCKTKGPIEQCPFYISVFFGRKTKSPCFDLFIHWLIKQITNTYRINFSRSYENRSNTVKMSWQSAVSRLVVYCCYFWFACTGHHCRDHCCRCVDVTGNRHISSQ